MSLYIPCTHLVPSTRPAYSRLTAPEGLTQLRVQRTKTATASETLFLFFVSIRPKAARVNESTPNPDVENIPGNAFARDSDSKN